MASIAKRPDGTFRPRYRDAAGREHARHFKRKVDAQRWLDEQTSALVRGDWIDPDRSRLNVGQWSQTWLAGRSHLKPKTLESYRSLLRTRVLPTWERVPLPKITHSDVAAGWPGCGPRAYPPPGHARRTTS